MTPVTFNGCFGWLHPGTGDRGVVLCGPLGHEAVATYRGWRQLAESLATQGLHVLRFDYHGTGDSEGDDAAPARIATWQGNIAAAASILREQCSVRSLTLVGLRFGATLAALAATTIPDVEALALLSPAVSGRLHLRELRLLARVWHEQALGKTFASGDDGSLEVTGTRHSSETVRDLGSIDLRLIARAPRRVLVMDNGDRLEARQFVDHLATLGSEVDRLPFVGEAEFLREPVTSRIPCDAFTHLSAWIGRSPRCPEVTHATSALDAELAFGSGTETPLRFGPNNNLFGILCRPRQPSVGSPLVLMVNTGRSRHTGDARFYVTLARELATLGTASLRMDIAGLGDSDSDPSLGPTLLHDTRSCRDISAAIDAAVARGWHRVSIVGICSGAFLAFQTAVRDPRVTRVDLINQQSFVADTVQVSTQAAPPRRRPASFYAKSLLRLYAWRALLSGRVDVAGVALGVVRPVVERYRRWIGRRYELVTGLQTDSGAVHRLFRQLTERGVRTRLWYGDSDPGWPELESWFGRGGKELRRFRGVDLHILPGADHALHGSEIRRHLTTLLCRETSSNYHSSESLASRTGFEPVLPP